MLPWSVIAMPGIPSSSALPNSSAPCGKTARLCSPTAVSLKAYSGHALTVESEIVGDSDILLKGESTTGSPHGVFVLNSANTNWFGRIALLSVPTNRNSDTREILSRWSSNYNTLRLYGNWNLGGRLPTFDARALEIRDHNELCAMNDVTLEASANRGILVSETCARINVTDGSTLTCGWPIALDARLYKTGKGTLALGAPVRPLVAAAAAERRTLVVTNGCVKALCADCLDGVAIDLGPANDVALAVDFNPSDTRLRRFGFCLVAADEPFAGGRPIRFRIDGGERAETASGNVTQGLLTVRTSAADRIAGLLTVANPLPKGGVRTFEVLRTDDVRTGLTTFAVRFGGAGFSVFLQ